MKKIGIIMGDPGRCIVETETFYAYALEGPDGKLTLEDSSVFPKAEHGHDPDLFMEKLGKWDEYAFRLKTRESWPN